MNGAIHGFKNQLVRSSYTLTHTINMKPMPAHTKKELKKRESDYESIRSKKMNGYFYHRQPPTHRSESSNISTIATPQLSPEGQYQPLKIPNAPASADASIVDSKLGSNYSFAKSENLFHLSDEENSVRTLSHSDIMTKVTKNSNKDYLEETLGKRRELGTNLDQLNFSQISANIRRSSLKAGSSRSSLFATTNKNSDVTSISTRSDYEYHKRKQKSVEKKHTSIVLPHNWSGKIVSSDQADEIYSYSMGQTINAFDLTGIIFKSNYPIETVTPSRRMKTANEDAISTLHSLDRKLKKEDNYYYYKSTVHLLTRSLTASPEKKEQGQYYRESKCLNSDMQRLSECILEKGKSEAQATRLTFHNHLQKIHNVLNEMFIALPEKVFPFKIQLLDLESHYERSAPNSVILYLVIDDKRLKNIRASFNMTDCLKATVLLPSKRNLGSVADLCVRNPGSSDLILSSQSLMTSFAKCFTDDKRADFEKVGRFSDDVQVSFETVSDIEVTLNVRLLKQEVKYRVGLHMALDVLDSPNVFELTENRDWPNNALKSQITKQGVHLTTKSSYNGFWEVLFMKTSNLLLEHIDTDLTLSQLLLSLQFINDRFLSVKECFGFLHPIHFVTLLFWTHVHFSRTDDWLKKNFGERFIDILIGLKRCLQRKECRDFILPKINYFKNFSQTHCDQLLRNLQTVLDEPLKVMQ